MSFKTYLARLLNASFVMVRVDGVTVALAIKNRCWRLPVPWLPLSSHEKMLLLLVFLLDNVRVQVIWPELSPMGTAIFISDMELPRDTAAIRAVTDVDAAMEAVPANASVLRSTPSGQTHFVPVYIVFSIPLVSSALGVNFHPAREQIIWHEVSSTQPGS